MTFYHTVYKTTNLINNKIYIGYHKTKNINDDYLGSGKHLKRAVQKYGKDNFIKEIIEVFDNKKDAEALEAQIVNKEFTEREDTYNIALGGNVRAFSGKNNAMYGVRHPQELIEQIHKTRAKTIKERGHARSAPTEYWCKRNTGEVFYTQIEMKLFYSPMCGITKPTLVKYIFDDINNLEFVVDWANEYFIKEYENKLETHRINKIEGSKKQSAARKGKRPSEETRRKMSEHQKGRKNPHTILINKNPEKIRKTAEKHRGMKRSAEAKSNISLAILENKKIQRETDPNYSPCNYKYHYKTPNGTFVNPYMTGIVGLTGAQIAIACRQGHINQKITKYYSEEKLSSYFNEIDYGKSYRDYEQPTK